MTEKLGSSFIMAFGLGFLLLGAGADASEPLGIDDVFHAALKRSETVANQDETAFQAHENVNQAVGNILPQINLTTFYFQQQAPSTPSSISTTTQKQAKLSGTQPLFQGLREYAGLRETKLTEQQQLQTAKQSRITLYQSAMTQFYQVLAAERDISNLEKESGMYVQRIKDLQNWVKIGRSRAADVTQIQASLYSLYSTLEASRNTLQSAREQLSFLSGLPKNVALKDPFPELFTPQIDLLDSYLAKIEERPDVRSFAFARDAADEGIRVARGSHLPTVDLTGDYYLARSGGVPGGTWDFQLTLTMPIFSGGTIQSKVRQAASQYHQGELNLSQGQRQANAQIRSYFEQVRLDHSQVEMLAQAKDYAWKNYQQETHDYRLGLVTNLDVLTSMTTFEEAERTYDRQRYQEKIDYLYLLSLTGKVNESEISF